MAMAKVHMIMVLNSIILHLPSLLLGPPAEEQASGVEVRSLQAHHGTPGDLRAVAELPTLGQLRA